MPFLVSLKLVLNIQIQHNLKKLKDNYYLK